MIYLDNAATTRPCPACVAAVSSMLTDHFANPSSLHGPGIDAMKEIIAARSALADALGVERDTLTFTSGGTEANNLALFGAAYANRRRGKRIVTTAIEHESIIQTADQLETEGFEVIRLQPDKTGNITKQQIESAITPDTILVSIMRINNEVGSILPVECIRRAVQKAGAPALIHTDCVQTFGKVPLRPDKLGIDLMTVTAHKIHGPKGVGALYVRKGVRILPRTFGGEQEKKRRTVIGVVCAAAAAVVLLVVLGVVLLRGSGTNDKPDTPEVEVPKLVGMKLEDINPDDYPELKIDLNGVTYDYNDEYEKGYVYEQTPKAGEMVKGGRVRTISLKVSLGKENNLMPDLTGQSEANAMSQLKAMNLGLNVRREEESSDTVPAGSVTRTDPAAETELQEGQSVTVYVSLGSGKMPELKNQSKENAKSILDAMNLNLRITYLEEESDDIASGNVTRTVPASDSQLSRGQQVTVYVSKGSGKVTVPPVTGLSVRVAIDLLTENGLKYEIKRVYSDTDEKDRVVRQSEAANSKVAKDTIVTLEVSDGPEPTEAPTEAPTTAPTEPEPTTESSESGD